MARKPIDIADAGAFPQTRDAIWAEIRQARRFTVRDLEVDARIGHKTVTNYVGGLVAAGYLRCVAQRTRGALGHYTQAVYELARDVGVEAPRVRKNGEPVLQGAARDQMWRTMRMLREFTSMDLAITASTEAVTVKPLDSRDYVKHLYRAGYLTLMQPAKPGHRGSTQARYKLRRNTGPRAPMVQATKQVYDPNLRQVVWRQGGVA